jgi:6-phosphogluconolactonase (cycloisomerase 2 family)
MAKWARLLLLAAPLLAGCKGFWQAPPATTTTTTLSSGNFYVLNKGTTVSSIYGFSIASGVLSQLTGSPYTVTGIATAMAIDSTGSYIYVCGTGGIYLYNIDSSTGALTQSSLISNDITGAALAVGAGDNWLLEASDAGELNAFPLTTTGTLNTSGTLQSVPLAGDQVQQMALSTNSPVAVLSVALGTAGTQVFPFTPAATSKPIGTASTTIKVTSPASAGASVAVAMDPQNRLMYVGETSAFPSSTNGNSGGLRAFTITATSSAITLAEISKTPYVSGGTGPHAITPEAAGDYVYVASWQGTSAGLVTPFQITTTGTTFSLTAETATTASGLEPYGMAEDSDDHFMLAVNFGGSPTLDAYIFDTTTTYQLDSAISDTTTTNPIAILAAP